MNYIDANGISLHYEVSGNGARPLVLLHEMGGSLESWNHVVAGLTEHFRVLRYDARGAGLSEKPRAPFSIDTLADDLAGLLDALGWSGPVALAGIAVGAAVAIHFAARSPLPVSGLVAMAPATGAPAERKAELLQLALDFETGGIHARISDRFDRSYPPRFFQGRSDREQVRGRLLANDPYTYAATHRMLAGLEMDDDFSLISCPTLVVAGQVDSTRPPDVVRKVADAIPGARFTVIDSGHAMAILTPSLVARELVDFLA